MEDIKFQDDTLVAKKINTEQLFVHNVDVTAALNSIYIPPKGVIVDTDWWTDVDDAVATRMLVWAEKAGLIDLVGVCIDAIKSTSVVSLDRFLNYEGRHGLCIGADKQATDYNRTPPYQDTCINEWPYGDYTSNDEAEDCVDFYRRALVSIPEGEKIDIISIGYLNAISRLLDSQADSHSPLSGIELVTQKVNRIWVMGGTYPSGSENNFNRTARARAAAYNVCTNCPVPMYFLGYEVGSSVKAGGGLQNTILGTDDLLYKCLEAYTPGVGTSGREAWDPMTVLLGCQDDVTIAGYTLKKGVNIVDAETGANTFTETSDGNHYYVVKNYPNNWYKQQINTICMKSAWPIRKVGRLQLSKISQ